MYMGPLSSGAPLLVGVSARHDFPFKLNYTLKIDNDVD